MLRNNSDSKLRFTAEHISQWREQGFVIIDNFFTPEEYAPVVADFDTLYADAGKGDGVGGNLPPNSC